MRDIFKLFDHILEFVPKEHPLYNVTERIKYNCGYTPPEGMRERFVEYTYDLISYFGGNETDGRFPNIDEFKDWQFQVLRIWGDRESTMSLEEFKNALIKDNKSIKE